MNSKTYDRFKIIDAHILKILAMFFMLLDHMWATIIPGNQWMTFVGRMAFPIFAFQISEGFVHTKYSMYIFYPLHMFILYLIFNFL